MKVSLDDGKTWLEVENLRIIQKIEDPTDKEPTDCEDEPSEVELHFNFTNEGIITDAWINNICEGSSSEMYLNIGDNLINH